MNDKKTVPLIKYGRSLVWHDEFNGNKINKELWGFRRTMTCPIAVYDNSEKHARIEDGMLHMQVNECGDTYSLCEGINTRETMLFKYGYLEMRAKPPFRHAAWPSFWMLANTPFHDESIGWFAEIDIFEIFSSINSLGPNLHKWGNSGHEMLPGDENNPNRGYKFKNPENLNEEFHIYGFLWDKNKMSFFVDGECYFSTSIDDSSKFKSERYPDTRGFHEPMYIIINNEIFCDKHDWYPKGSPITKEDKMPIDYYIDWVRLYQDYETEQLILGEELKKAY